MGEVIRINVIFNFPVVVTGLPPRLKLEIGNDRYAIYQPQLSGSDLVVFEFTVELGDETDDLSYSGPAVDQFFGTCIVYRAADIPVALANLSLPMTRRTVAESGNVIRIRTSSAFLPHITRVAAVSPDGTYRAGDSLLLKIEISRYVVGSDECSDESAAVPYRSLSSYWRVLVVTSIILSFC